jgi:hypothetical protein
VTSPTAATQATTRTIPPPLTLESGEKGGSSKQNPVTATTSPLLYRNFGASLSPPSHPNPLIKCSPVGAAPALRQKVEQSVIEDNKKIDVPAGIGGSSPQSPTPLAVATAFSLPIASATSEKKRSDDPPPLVEMNPTRPPPPYTPKAPPPLETTSGPTGDLLQVWLLKYFASLLAFFSA